MHEIKKFKVALLGVFEHLLVVGVDMLRVETVSEHLCNEREQLKLLSLVIKKLRFLFPAADIPELSSHY